MKLIQLFGQLLRRLSRHGFVALALAFPLLGFPLVANAQTDIQLWAALNPHNAAVLEKQIRQFNRSQNDARVQLRLFDTTDNLEVALQAAATEKKLPHLVQLNDHRWPEGVAAKPYIQPLYSLLQKQKVGAVNWFIAPEYGFMRDSQGRLLALPYMAEVPLMFYNRDAFKKAGLGSQSPKRSWQGLQDQLVDLANKATRQCPATTDQPVSINLENLAAVNNQFFVSNDNGHKSKATPAFTFDVVYVRHLALMIAWVRTELLVGPGLDHFAVERFADNECSVLLSVSSNLGDFRQTKGLNFGVSGLPYYPQVTEVPGIPFLEGSGLWATAGHAADAEKAMANFVVWLTQPDQASQWHQETGFIPLTQEAFAQTPEAYYQALGDWRHLVEVYQKAPSSTGRGFRVNNYPKVRTMFQETLRDALNGQQTAAAALSAAAAEAAKLLETAK